MESNNFTIPYYIDLLSSVIKKFDFCLYADDFQNKDKIVIWRHDVDFSPQRALKLAKIEYQHGVKTTYFILLTGNFYNIFEPENQQIISDIIACGHDIGLHFDPCAHNIKTEKDINTYLEFEKSILEMISGKKVKVFSLHNPTVTSLKLTNKVYADMLNAEHEGYKNNFHFCSDSNGYWRDGSPNILINNETVNKLMVLIHPAWWQETALSPRQRIERCIQGRKDATGKSYDDLLDTHNRHNIGQTV